MKRVLVVDDDLATRSDLAEFLADAGFECTAVGTFQEAVALLRTQPPDLLITDIRLQEYNGLQLVVTANPLCVPAIVLTGFADHVLASVAHRYGAAYFLKPVRLTTLLHLVQELLADSNREPAELNKTLTNIDGPRG